MAHYLPPTILKYFEPRPPLDYVPPPDINRTPAPPLTGLAAFLSCVPSLLASHPPPTPLPTKADIRLSRRASSLRRHQRLITRLTARWSPKTATPAHTKDAYKTLFVARLAHSLTAADVQKEFEYYGPIVHTHLPLDRKGRSRGYAFVEFHSTRDMTKAFKDADGRKISGRRILVDVERGRTVKAWKPRRLGGGLGGTRLGGKEVNQTFSGREADKGKEKGGAGEVAAPPQRFVHNDRQQLVRGPEPPPGDHRERDGHRGEREREREGERGRHREEERGADRDRGHSSRDYRGRDDRDRERDRGREGEKRRDGGREEYRGGRDRETAGETSRSGAGLGFKEDRGRMEGGGRWERDRYRPERSTSRGR